MKLRWSLIALVVAPVAAFSDEMPSSAESQSLIRKIVAITDESDLTNTARIRRILGIGSLLNTSEWREEP